MCLRIAILAAAPARKTCTPVLAASCESYICARLRSHSAFFSAFSIPIFLHLHILLDVFIGVYRIRVPVVSDRHSSIYIDLHLAAVHRGLFHPYLAKHPHTTQLNYQSRCAPSTISVSRPASKRRSSPAQRARLSSRQWYAEWLPLPDTPSTSADYLTFMGLTRAYSFASACMGMRLTGFF